MEEKDLAPPLKFSIENRDTKKKRKERKRSFFFGKKDLSSRFSNDRIHLPQSGYSFQKKFHRKDDFHVEISLTLFLPSYLPPPNFKDFVTIPWPASPKEI